MNTTSLQCRSEHFSLLWCSAISAHIYIALQQVAECVWCAVNLALTNEFTRFPDHATCTWVAANYSCKMHPSIKLECTWCPLGLTAPEWKSFMLGVHLNWNAPELECT